MADRIFTIEVDPLNTREEWLTTALEKLREHVFAPHDLDIPPYRVSVGWPLRCYSIW
jgi:hypothetical protein